MQWSARILSCLIAAGSLPATAPLAAQQAPTVEQVILGRLLDDQTRQPIATGAVHLLRPDSSVAVTVMTDSAGRFRITTRSVGVYRLRAERIGYQPATGPEIRLVLRDTLRLDFHLLPDAVLHSPLVVTAERTLAPYYAARGMEDFYRRMMTLERSAISGQFLTREALDRWDNSTTTDMLANMRGIETRGAGSIWMRNCQPRYYVDGVEYQLTPGQTVDSAFPPHMLEAVEVYVGQNVPGEFFGRGCGVIVFWLRR